MTTKTLHPYYDVDFGQFFVVLLQRVWGFITGQISLSQIAPDELQLFVLMAVSASAALLGVFLVLRQMTMLANALSHTLLIGIVAVVYLTQSGFLVSSEGTFSVTAMLVSAVIMAFVTTFLTEFLTRKLHLQVDASTGLVFTFLFAVGIVAVTVLSKSSHVGLEVVMGNVDALNLNDCRLVLCTLGINVVLIILFFKEYQITTFDAGLANSLGISSSLFSYLLMAQTALCAISAFRAVGVILVMGFFAVPPVAARFLTHRLKTLLFLSVGISWVASLVGVAWSRHLLSQYGIALSTGGLVVCVLALLLSFSTLYKAVSRKKYFN